MFNPIEKFEKITFELGRLHPTANIPLDVPMILVSSC